MSEVHLLIGPDAGRGRADGAAATVLEVMRANGADPVDLTGRDAEASAAAARAAVAEGSTRLVVAGGDGMVHLAAQAVAGTGTVLGVVPVGTGNDFARGIPGIPDDVATAAAVSLGDPTPIDAIDAGHRWIASVATAGFAGDVNERANRFTWPRGPSRYSLATVVELPSLRLRDISLEVDGVSSRHRAALLAVGNTGWFGGGMEICPTADPDDGMLEITIVGAVGRLELLRWFRSVFSGDHLSHAKVATLRGREVTIDCDGLDLWGDGELVGPASTTLRAVPGALRLAC